jgi:hypothetical protein
MVFGTTTKTHGPPAPTEPERTALAATEAADAAEAPAHDVIDSDVDEPTPERAAVLLQDAQSALHGLRGQRADLVRAYYSAIEQADGAGMVAVRRRLGEVDEKVVAAGIGAERAAVELALAESRAIGQAMGPAMEEGRQARERRYGARGDARVEREAIEAQIEADRRVRQLQDEHARVTQRLARARISLKEAIATARRRID